ncbi:MAG: histidine phosphatase family protein [Patescibacteria group bacterium]|nr:histidine phosphatase family protein [Patescibacteria group bacterium]
MAMPTDLVLVRHGESEGNVANRHSREGDNTLFTKEFKSRHSSLWRLTDKGIEQAKIAGKWIKENISENFDVYFTSEYIRAMETATYLDLKNANWLCDFYLREREIGDLERTTFEEREKNFSNVLKLRANDSYYWVPANGESIANLCTRLKWVLDRLHREAENKKAIIICHGDVIWGFRVLLERISQEEFSKLDSSKDPLDWIYNGQVFHYSRKNPVTGEISPWLRWMKSVCPNNLSLSRNEWVEINRPRLTNKELLNKVNKVKRIIKQG